MKSGAIAAGLSGTGPAVVALADENPGRIADSWKQFEGTVIGTNTNNKKARIL
jgi:shikimate kinase